MENTASQEMLTAGTAISLKKYYFVFAAVLLAAIIATVALSAIGIDFGKSSSTIQLIAAIVVVTQLFVKDHRRKPSKKEKRKLYIGSLFIAFAVSGICVTVFLLLDPSGELARSVYTIFSRLSPAITLGIVMFVAFISYLLIVLFYTIFFKIFAQKNPRDFGSMSGVVHKNIPRL